MSEHIKRMKQEYIDLKEKHSALGSFIHLNSKFNELDKYEQVRMIQQLGFMKSYLDVLDSRLWVGHGNPERPATFK